MLYDYYCISTISVYYFYREEFDKVDLSESTNLIHELVIAADIRKVRFICFYILSRTNFVSFY